MSVVVFLAFRYVALALALALGVVTLLTSLKKVCYKVSLCKNCQRQSCKAFIGLTNRAKLIGGGDPFYLKFWVQLTALERNRRFFYLFLLVAT